MTGFLIDTNAFLFLGLRSDRVAGKTLSRLRRGTLYVSQVCAIEIAIKQTLGKLKLPRPFQTGFALAFEEIVHQLNAKVLMIEMAHVDRLSHLPMYHRDPFDRLMISQAISENLTVVTRDEAFQAYLGLDIMEI